MENYRNNIISIYVNILSSYISRIVNMHKLVDDYTIEIESISINEETKKYTITLVIKSSSLIDFIDNNKLWNQISKKLYLEKDKINIQSDIYKSDITNLYIELDGNNMIVIYDLIIEESKKNIEFKDLPIEMVGEIAKNLPVKESLDLCIATKYNKYNNLYCDEIYKTNLFDIYKFIIKDINEDIVIDYVKLSEELLSNMHYYEIPIIYKFLNTYIKGHYGQMKPHEMIKILASFYSVNMVKLDNWNPKDDILSELLRLLSLNPNISNYILHTIHDIMKDIYTYNNNKNLLSFNNIIYYIPYMYIHLLINPNIYIYDMKTIKNSKKISTIPPNLEYLLNIYNPINPSSDDIKTMYTVITSLIKDKYNIDKIKLFYDTIDKYITEKMKKDILKNVVQYGNLGTLKYLITKIGIPNTANEKVKLITRALINIKAYNSEYETITFNDEIVNYLSNIFGYDDYKINKFNLMSVARKSGDTIIYNKLQNEKITNKDFNNMILRIRNMDNLINLLFTYPNNSINQNVLYNTNIVDVTNQNNIMLTLVLLNDKTYPEKQNGRYIIRIAGGAGDTHIEEKRKTILISRSLQHPNIDPTSQNNKAIKNAAIKSRYNTITVLKKDGRIPKNAIYDAVFEAINKDKSTSIKFLLHGEDIPKNILNEFIKYSINKNKNKIEKYLRIL